MQLTGLILSGGKSKRAGTDKGLKTLDGIVWVDLMVKKLKDVGLETKVSINQEQLLNYSQHLPSSHIIVDKIEIPGPLKGILTAHHYFPKANWLVVACDMIDLDQETIEKMLKACKKNPGFDFYTYKNTKFHEPFCAIYSAKALKSLREKFINKDLDNFSLQGVFNTFNTFSIAINDDAKAFNNYNT